MPNLMGQTLKKQYKGMETIKTSQKSYSTNYLVAPSYSDGSLVHADDMEAKRKALYKEAYDYSTEVYGWYDDLEDFGEIFVNDRELDKLTGKDLIIMYMDALIGDFDTSEDVVKYYQDECAVFEGEDPEELGARFEWRGDIIKIGDRWYWNL